VAAGDRRERRAMDRVGDHTKAGGDRIISHPHDPAMSRRRDPINPTHQADGANDLLQGTSSIRTVVRMGTYRPLSGRASGRDRLPSSSPRTRSHQNRQEAHSIGIRRSSVTSRVATIFVVGVNSRNEDVPSNQLKVDRDRCEHDGIVWNVSARSVRPRSLPLDEDCHRLGVGTHKPKRGRFVLFCQPTEMSSANASVAIPSVESTRPSERSRPDCCGVPMPYGGMKYGPMECRSPHEKARIRRSEAQLVSQKSISFGILLRSVRDRQSCPAGISRRRIGRRTVTTVPTPS
jgi:hypothetical protein